MGRKPNSMILNRKQSEFLASYKLTGNATESALNAGYSAKSAHIEGYRLLRKPKIIAELELWKDKKRQETSKDNFVDMALNDYKQLDVEQPNKPRFLDIAGRALGHLGSNQSQQPNQTLNLTNITVNKLESLTQAQLWGETRRLLDELT